MLPRRLLIPLSLIGGCALAGYVALAVYPLILR